MELPEGRSGHIAVSFRNNIIVWGGYQEYSFMDTSKIWIYDINKETWSVISANGTIPPDTSGSCAALIDSSLYIFAGCTNAGNSNEIYVLDLLSFTWTKMVTESGKPSCRNKLSCWVVGDRIIYFGGYGERPRKENVGNGEFIVDQSLNYEVGWNNDLIVYNTLKNTWKALPNHMSPAPRAAHTCVTLNQHTGYLFGGRHKERRLDDLHTFCFDTHQWSQVSCRCKGPEGRSWHTFIPVDHSNLFLFGGLTSSGRMLGDEWIFNCKDETWYEMHHRPGSDVRIWHSACQGIFPGHIVIFGGSTSNVYINAEHTNTIMVFQFHPIPLVRLALEAVIKHKENTVDSWKDLPRELRKELFNLMGGG